MINFRITHNAALWGGIIGGLIVTISWWYLLWPARIFVIFFLLFIMGIRYQQLTILGWIVEKVRSRKISKKKINKPLKKVMKKFPVYYSCGPVDTDITTMGELSSIFFIFEDTPMRAVIGYHDGSTSIDPFPIQEIQEAMKRRGIHVDSIIVYAKGYRVWDTLKNYRNLYSTMYANLPAWYTSSYLVEVRIHAQKNFYAIASRSQSQDKYAAGVAAVLRLIGKQIVRELSLLGYHVQIADRHTLTLWCEITAHIVKENNMFLHCLTVDASVLKDPLAWLKPRCLLWLVTVKVTGDRVQFLIWICADSTVVKSLKNVGYKFLTWRRTVMLEWISPGSWKSHPHFPIPITHPIEAMKIIPSSGVGVLLGTYNNLKVFTSMVINHTKGTVLTVHAPRFYQELLLLRIMAVFQYKTVFINIPEFANFAAKYPDQVRLGEPPVGDFEGGMEEDIIEVSQVLVPPKPHRLVIFFTPTLTPMEPYISVDPTTRSGVYRSDGIDTPFNVEIVFGENKYLTVPNI